MPCRALVAKGFGISQRTEVDRSTEEKVILRGVLQPLVVGVVGKEPVRSPAGAGQGRRLSADLDGWPVGGPAPPCSPSRLEIDNGRAPADAIATAPFSTTTIQPIQGPSSSSGSRRLVVLTTNARQSQERPSECEESKAQVPDAIVFPVGSRDGLPTNQQGSPHRPRR